MIGIDGFSTGQTVAPAKGVGGDDDQTIKAVTLHASEEFDWITYMFDHVGKQADVVGLFLAIHNAA